MAEVVVAKGILKANDLIAKSNQDKMNQGEVFGVNMLGSPGGGKTTILEYMLPILKEKSINTVVIEGDLATSRDADRVEALGVPTVQINTEGGCHLDANMVSSALDTLNLKDSDLLFIENVGNLVCTAGYELGEHLRLAILSVTEGDDKVEKYPTMFQRTDAIIINKVDLLEYTNFDVEMVHEQARKLNKDVEIFQVSARTGAGIAELADWLLEKRKSKANRL